MKYLKVWLSAMAILGLMAPAAQGLSWDQRHNRVRFETLQNPKSTTHEAELTIKASARKVTWGRVSPSLMLCIGRRESGDALNERAVNSTSGAAGLFQHIPKYWPGRVAAYNRTVGERRPWLKTGTSVFNMRSNALVSAWMMRKSLSPWGGGC